MNKNIIRVSIFMILFVGVALALTYRDLLDVAALETWIKDAGAAGPIIFILIYALAAVFFLPGSVLTLAGGALFGPVWGSVFNLTGAVIGATLAFLISRYLASDWAEKKAGGRLKQLKNGVEGEGWRFVAFVRLVPLFPFSVLNYALGLTKIKLSHYVIASLVCMVPGGVAYTYLGYVGRQAAAGDEAIIQKVLIGISLLAIVSFLPRLMGKLRQKEMMNVEQLNEKISNNKNIVVLDVRTESEFSGEQSHVVGAINIPLEALESRINELGDYEEKMLVTICRTDKRSVKAAKILATQGFADVHVIKGGMVDWHKHKFIVA